MVREDKKKIFEKAKEANQVIEGRKRPLDDTALEGVAGGYWEDETSWPSYGWWIQCPNCGQSCHDCGEGGVYIDSCMNTVEYTCPSCGAHFIVDCDNGATYLAYVWQNMCNGMGYQYPYT